MNGGSNHMDGIETDSIFPKICIFHIMVFIIIIVMLLSCDHMDGMDYVYMYSPL